MGVVSEAAALIRKARDEAGLSQADLGRRLGISQAAVAKLERPGSNPTVDTLGDVLWAAGRELVLAAPVKKPGVDEPDPSAAGTDPSAAPARHRNVIRRRRRT